MIMNQFKKCKVVMLSTNKKANGMLCIDATGIDKSLYIKSTGMCEHSDYVAQHLYILSDDKIEASDWYYNGEQILQYGNHFPSSMSLPNNCKKVIATTDKSLEVVNKGINPVYEKLPQPSEAFIKKYIDAYNKGQVIENVMVEYEVKNYTIIKTFPPNFRTNYQVRVSKNNTITTKKVKDSWTREEVVALLRKFTEDRGDYLTKEYLPKWIQENL